MNRVTDPVNDLIRFPCPSCRRRLKARPEDQGRSGSCRHCGGRFQVPILGYPRVADDEGPAEPRSVVPWVLGGAAALLAAGVVGLGLAIWFVLTPAKPPAAPESPAVVRRDPPPTSAPAAPAARRPDPARASETKADSTKPAGGRLEWVTKPPPDLKLNDAFMRLKDTGKAPGDEDTPPPQSFPSGTAALDLIMRFDREPPKGNQFDIRVSGPSGPIPLKDGPVRYALVIRDGRYAWYDWIIPCEPKDGSFAAGPYQTRVLVNGTETAVVHWSAGGPGAPAAGGGGTAPPPPAVADGPKPDGDLRGAAGPRLEWVTKPPADLGLTDMAMSNGDLTKFEGGKPPPTAFPSGTKSLDLVARFKSAPPDGTRITAEVRGRAGSVGLKGGPLITSQNNATGEFDVLLMCSPKNGDYADGPYQTRVIVNGAETALLNWSVGGAAAPAPPEPPAARGDLPEVMEWHRIKTFNLYVSGGGTVSPSNSDDVFVGVKVRLPAKLIGGAPRNGGLDYTFTNFDCVLKFPDGSKRSASGLAREKGNYDANYYVQHADYGKTETDPPSFVRWVLFAVPRKQLEAGGLKFSFKGCPAVPLTAEGRTEDRDG